MHSFKAMDPQRIQELLEATNEKGEKLYPDILTPLAKQEGELFARSPCPKCGALAVSTLDSHRPFVPYSPLPNRILRCVVCLTEFDPKSGLITLASIIDGSA